MDKKTKTNLLGKKVTAVWIVQGNKRFLLNYFLNYENAHDYVNILSHFKINGELLLGEIPIKNLVE